jgi:hypothetical protein
MPQARCHTEPGLLAKLYQDSIFDGLQVNRQGGMPAGVCACACSNLDRHLILGSQNLSVHIAAVEFRHEGVCDVIRFDVAVKNSSFHVFDYRLLVLYQNSCLFCGLLIIIRLFATTDCRRIS